MYSSFEATIVNDIFLNVFGPKKTTHIQGYSQHTTTQSVLIHLSRGLFSDHCPLPLHRKQNRDLIGISPWKIWIERDLNMTVENTNQWFQSFYACVLLKLTTTMDGTTMDGTTMDGLLYGKACKGIFVWITWHFVYILNDETWVEPVVQV